VAAGRDAGFDAVPYSDPQSLIEALAARGIEL
jgi:hypothetical protein